MYRCFLGALTWAACWLQQRWLLPAHFTSARAFCCQKQTMVDQIPHLLLKATFSPSQKRLRSGASSSRLSSCNAFSTGNLSSLGTSSVSLFPPWPVAFVLLNADAFPFCKVLCHLNFFGLICHFLFSTRFQHLQTQGERGAGGDWCKWSRQCKSV